MTIEDAVAQDFTLVGSGRFLKTVEHDSLVVDTVQQVFHWNSKHIHGNVVDWFRKIKNQPCDIKFNILETCKELEEVEINLPDMTLVDLFHSLVSKTKYWTEYRGYTEKTIKDFKLGYTGEWNTIPIYEDGKFVNFQCRMNEPKKIKHWYSGVGPHTFNFSILPFCKDYVFICESPVDAIMLSQHNLNAVSQTAGSGQVSLFAKNIVKFINIKTIYAIYDNDNAGREGIEKIVNLFGDRVKGFTFPGFADKYDCTDFFKEGHTKEEFLNLVGIL